MAKEACSEPAAQGLPRWKLVFNRLTAALGCSRRSSSGSQDAFSSAAPKEKEESEADAVKQQPEASSGLAESSTLTTNAYSAPRMSQAEMDAITVPLDEVKLRLRQVMDEYGVAIVSGVLASQSELQEMEDLFRADLDELFDEEALNDAPEEVRSGHEQYRKGGPLALPHVTAKRLASGTGFLLTHCLPHGRFAWAARRHPNVHAVYKELHAEEMAEKGDTDELVTSIDVTFFTSGEEPERNSAFFSAHCDQNKHDAREGLNEQPSYQGVVYVWPASGESAASTTVVWPKSHKTVWPRMMQDERFRAKGDRGFHYCEIRKMGDRKLAGQLADGWASHARRCVVPAGALLLWNSKTIHTGWLGGPRLAQPVCLEPRSRRSHRNYIAKLRLAALGLPSTHWASVGMQHDMIPSGEGYLWGYRPGEGWQNVGGKLAKVVGAIPCHSAIRPVGLAQGADLDQLSKIVNVPFDLVCLWTPPDDKDYAWLEACVNEDVRKYL